MSNISSAAVGTPAYLAPETLMGRDCRRAVSSKADVYSWAVMASELLNHERPWRQLGMMQIFYQVTITNARPGKAARRGCEGCLTAVGGA